MARVDDYQASFDISAAALAEDDFDEVAGRSGGVLAPDGKSLTLNYYGRPVLVQQSPCLVRALDEGPEIPLAEQALILHYLERADGSRPSGEWVTFREVEAGEFYWSAFVKRAKTPLLNFFGQRPEFLLKLAPEIGGQERGGFGDTAVFIPAFPLTGFLLVLWYGDEEFPPEANVLMDRNVGRFLSTEDIALAAGLCVYKLMALGR